ncbi:hypothetical protein BDV95DRAFT_628912 [Massariosphaeria phaeospora]|uniref:Translation initiation factor IF-2, mitochondrial n=1 Tax=Massariosphaeria phaeospora TaxID=100035 RepID=A0A7C8I513_9PLEO|nr:hypothetical protein BDV95DRAFT_628912 [Massariosphaeria phaeospora]
MRKARIIRASSTRDVCILCATRQFAAAYRSDAIIASAPSVSQRRTLNSSSKAPQYASEGAVYKEERPPAKPMTQAEKMRQHFLATAPRAAPTPQPRPSPGQMSPAERMKATMQGQSAERYMQQPYAPARSQQGQAAERYVRQPYSPARSQQGQQSERYMQQPYSPARSQQQQQQQQRPPVSRGNVPGGSGRNQRDGGYGSGYYTHRAPEAPRPNHYNVNLGSKPPVADTPVFNSDGLRRRNEPPSSQATPSENPWPAPAPRRKLDQAEMDRLLGNKSQTSSMEAPPQYARLSRDTNVQSKCFHCGAQDHRALDCPSKPTLRQPSQVTPAAAPHYQAGTQHRNQEKAGYSLAHAAEAWARKEGIVFPDSQSAEQAYSEAQQQRRNPEGSERRINRFEMPSNPPALGRNRYDEPQRRRRGDNDRRPRGRVMREDEEDDRSAAFVSKDEIKRQRKEAKQAKLAQAKPTPVYLPEYISVANLASILKQRVEDFVRKLEDLGFEDVQNDHILNAEHAGLVAQEFNFEPIIEVEGEDGDLYPTPALSPEEYAELPARPPVVTIMGHVDHGKTTILDYMRNSSVAATEFGGITQHIGAFSVPLASGKTITFLDTPGHSAFETMRARGANVTDIVVLVVAADDSVMPQTVEAIKHAQAAKVPIIVAINKIDRSQADPEKVKLDLGRHGIEVEDFGGDVQAVPVSGKTGQGIPDLEEAISTLSEMLDHRADPAARVEGWVLEGTTKKSGRVATVLVRSGTLRQGDALVAGTTWARVRTLRNEAGATVKEIGPGMPVEIDGWREQPIAGDEVIQATDEQEASSVSELRSVKLERQQMAKDMSAINESRRLETERREAEQAAATAAATAAANGEEAPAETPPPLKETGPELVSFIVKGDVSGSVEAVIDSISAIGNAEVGTRILRHGVGPPSEFDVQHAADASGHIVNFNTAVPAHIAALAEHHAVRILDGNIIYRVVENVKALMSAKLPPKITQRVTGEADIAAVFEIGLGGRRKLKVAGSKVRNGVVARGAKVRVLRADAVVFDGALSSLKNVKKDVEEMRMHTECGLAFADWEDFAVGDRVQCYEEKSEKRSF